MRPIPLSALSCAWALLYGCGSAAQPDDPLRQVKSIRYGAKGEIVEDFGRLVPDAGPRRAEMPVVALERVTTAVPWPRGLAWVNAQLIVLARGRHRNAGGVDHDIEDRTGSLFAVDPAISEPVLPNRLASSPVRANAGLLAAAEPDPFQLPDRSKEPREDTLMDRPYCTLIWDPPSRNLFICGYSGVDLPGRRFRKNATDSIHRYDLRTRKWYPVEMHSPRVVPRDELGYVVSNTHYPHHDPDTNPPPHGWLNGPDTGTVVGDYLYCASKDNHLVVQYDLDEIRRNPNAGCPASRAVLGPRVRLRSPRGLHDAEVLGPSAVTHHGDWLYVGYRTSSIIVRFRIEADGKLRANEPAELIAVFEPWDPVQRRSANLIDIAFNGRGELFASCAKEGRIWKIGVPDPRHPFYGNDQGSRPTTAAPLVDLRAHTGKKTGCGNILFDPQDRLYICSGNYDTESELLAGVVYRATWP